MAAETAGHYSIEARFAALEPDVRARLAAYRDELLLWNTRFNLTAVTDSVEVDRRLIGDALRLLPAIDEGAGAGDPLGGGQGAGEAERRGRGEAPGEIGVRLVDIGSGGGLPGLVIKIARPDLDVTLIEATGKKVGFLRHLVAMLGLTGITAVHGRAEELGHNPAYRGRYELATARAVAALPVLLEFCVPFVRVGGTVVMPKGGAIDQELAEGKRAARILGARIESAALMPGAQDETVTRLVIAAKIGETPSRYPRRSGVPAREPLGRARP